MKGLFITLPQRGAPDNFPPYGALAVINSLHKADYEDVSLYNIDVLRPSRQEAVDYIVSFNPEILCISAPVSTAYDNCKFYSLEVKKRLPDIKIVLGGNLAASAEVLLHKTGVDYCVLGEGEIVCRNLFDKIINGSPLSEFHSLRGLAFLDGGKLVNTGYAEQLPAESIYNINWDDLDPTSVNNYFPKIKELDISSSYYKYFFSSEIPDTDISNKTIGVMSCSKGCIGRCTFCHRFIFGIRFVPPEIAIARIQELIERFDTGAIAFADECFGAGKKWLHRFCELIKPLDILWKVGGMRVDMVNPEIVSMMKEAGCRSIIYGLETGSEKILNVMEKRVSIQNNLDAVKWTVNAGLLSTPALVIGMPGETNETIIETATFIGQAKILNKSQNPAEMSITFAQALPGTPLYEYGRATGKIGQTSDEEENYLLFISDRNASDETTTLNFTDSPRLLQIAWPLLIKIIVNNLFVEKYGAKRLLENVFGNKNIPTLLSLVKQKNISGIFYIYPKLSYSLRNCLWIISLIKVYRAHGLKLSSDLFVEYLKYTINGYFQRKKRAEFHYKSLRKILDDDIRCPYSGTKEMEPLRRGR